MVIADTNVTAIDDNIMDVDEQGIKKIYPNKQDGFNWAYEIPALAANAKFSTESDGAPVANGNFFTIKAHEGGLQSGGTQQTCRLHIIPNASNVAEGTEGTWKLAKDRGWLAAPTD